MLLLRMQSGNGSRIMLAAACLFGLLGVTDEARATVINDVWMGGDSNWNSAANWSAALVPNNGANTFNVFIDNGNPVASHVGLDISAVISSLTIDGDDQLTINNAHALTLSGSGLTNSGILALNSSG